MTDSITSKELCWCGEPVHTEETERMKAEQQACAVPLIEQLRSVPLNAHHFVELPNNAGYRNIPFGPWCHAAADEIERLQRELAKSQDAVDYYYALAKGTGHEPLSEHPPLLMAVVDKWQDKANAIEAGRLPPHSGHAATINSLLSDIRRAAPPPNHIPDAGKMVDHVVDGNKMVGAQPPGESLAVDPEYRLPCEVKLPIAMTIGKGVHLKTLLLALKQRESWDEHDCKFPGSVEIAAMRERLGLTKEESR